jgi:hypothetical protein
MPLLPQAPLAGSCPACGRTIEWRDVSVGRAFRCPSCRISLRTGSTPGTDLIAWTISLLMALAIGLHGPWLTCAVLVGAIPLTIGIRTISWRFFPVRFEAAGRFRGLLYTGDEDDATPQAPPVDIPQPWIGARIWEFFSGINRPPTVEGVAIQAGFLILAVAFIWTSLVPLLRYTFPRFDADRSGPQGFPVAVHIDTWALTITNGSDAAWTCRAELGRGRLANSFDVAARRTIPIEFARFNPNGRFKESEIRSAAQERISILCGEPSGRRHFATLR